MHHTNNDTVPIDSGRLREKARGKRSVKMSGMIYAELAGDCCWEVRQRKIGGEFRHLMKIATMGMHNLPWDIKYVKLIKC